jgi:hypothetical protein
MSLLANTLGMILSFYGKNKNADLAVRILWFFGMVDLFFGTTKVVPCYKATAECGAPFLSFRLRLG